MDELKLLVVVHNPDVISNTETWLSPYISDGEVAISYIVGIEIVMGV